PVPQQPQPGDLAVGPLIIISGKIDNAYAPHGVTAATYHSCSHAHGFFAQAFAFTDGKIRGCVPLEVRVAGHARVQRVTLSLFAGSCAA
ncbi:MAG TPA: hypothetical protein VHS32_28660, partial [Streptosporangiaceae bacterium]|nr:hypothetical protein [Streptosporangiaceae bacterium]